MKTRGHLIRVQRALYDRLNRYSRTHLGEPSPELKKYSAEYQKDLGDFQETSLKISSKRELVERVVGAHVVLCGDYHSLSQAQKTVLRLLREAASPLRAKKRRVVLALEMLSASDNARTAAFLEGRMTEKSYLEAIRFRQNWGFAWASYRPLFEFARRNDFGIVGLNADRPSTLAARDKRAADEISRHARHDTLVFAVIGDLHLAENHLPRRLKRRRLRPLVIHQNPDPLYWKLVAKGWENHVNVVRLRPSMYCVVNTPPWVKIQSYLAWEELLADGTVCDPDDVRSLVKLVQNFVGVVGHFGDDFSLVRYSPRNLRALPSRGTRAGKAEAKFLRQLLRERESFYLHRASTILLSSMSLNHMASQAAIYLHARVSGASGKFEDPARDFYSRLWIEALGFLGSKIVNPRRKCPGPRDLERRARGVDASGSIEVARAALMHLREEIRHRGERGRFMGLRTGNRNLVFFHEVAMVLGQILGQALYDASTKNLVKRSELRALFANPFRSTEARTLYLRWTRRLDVDGLRSFSQGETL